MRARLAQPAGAAEVDVVEVGAVSVVVVAWARRRVVVVVEAGERRGLAVVDVVDVPTVVVEAGGRLVVGATVMVVVGCGRRVVVVAGEVVVVDAMTTAGRGRATAGVLL